MASAHNSTARMVPANPRLATLAAHIVAIIGAMPTSRAPWLALKRWLRVAI